MMAPALPDIAHHYNLTSETTIALTLSIFLITFAIGPLFLAPLSEMYGRTWVRCVFLPHRLLATHHLIDALGSPHRKPVVHGFPIRLRILANCGCLDRIPHPLYVTPLRVFTRLAEHFGAAAGFAGSAPIACGGGSISDLFSEKERASAMAIYSLGPLLGPVIGPVAGGFIAQSVGFRYIFVVVGGLSAFAAIFGIPLLRETYHPVIRLRRAKKSADPERAAKLHPHLVQEHGSKLHRLWVDMSRPFILLTQSIICFLLSAYMAL